MMLLSSESVDFLTPRPGSVTSTNSSRRSLNVRFGGFRIPRATSASLAPRARCDFVRVHPSRSSPSVSMTCRPSASAYLILQTVPRLPCTE